MGNFFQKITQFMYGRYGNDKLNIGLCILWLIINIINTVFFRIMWIQLFTYLIVAVIIFRCLSRNISQRSKENEKFMEFCDWARPGVLKVKQFFHKVVEWFRLQYRKFKDRKTHRYIKCPYCKAVIRVPFRKGNHSVKCPRCTEPFKTNIRF